MKFVLFVNNSIFDDVTSYAEVWIEIWYDWYRTIASPVTSYAEVWIEMEVYIRKPGIQNSHLLRGGVD